MMVAIFLHLLCLLSFFSLGLATPSVFHDLSPSRFLHSHSHAHRRRSSRGTTALQGWPLTASASTIPDPSLQSCGGGNYCPATLFCVGKAQEEQSACCSSASDDCYARVNSTQTCADSRWSFWSVGDRSFCCDAGLEGSLDDDGNVICSDSTPSEHGLVKQGKRQAPKPRPASRPPSTPLPQATAAKGRPVLMHYMLAGVTEQHCEKDVADAKSIGVDAFVVNFGDCSSQWAQQAIGNLFNYGGKYGLKIIFSFDMSAGFYNPYQFIGFLQYYYNNPNYFRYNGVPVVSTFNGAYNDFGTGDPNTGWQTQLKDKMAQAGQPIFFMPAFQEIWQPQNFFSRYPVADGAVNWHAWAQPGSGGGTAVPTVDDQQYMDSARSQGKKFCMALSPVNYKHLDGNTNWYWRSEQNIGVRFGQALTLQPDMVQLLSWNDVFEGHNMGYYWDEAVNFPSTQNGMAYATDHSAFLQVLPSFIQAYKGGYTDVSAMYPTNGNSVQGMFFHHPILANSNCNDWMGRPYGSNGVEDDITALVVVAQGTTNLNIVILSNGNTLVQQPLKPGLNIVTGVGMNTGRVQVNIVDSNGRGIISGTSNDDVRNYGNIYNFNIMTTALT